MNQFGMRRITSRMGVFGVYSSVCMHRGVFSMQGRKEVSLSCLFGTMSCRPTVTQPCNIPAT